VQVSSGSGTLCALRTEGSIVCWGINGVAKVPRGKFVQVSAGNYFACGVRSGGTLVCWGDPWTVPETPPSGKFTQVSSGSAGFACGLRRSGSLACWGYKDWTRVT
jgi:Regulator of chromosome condensation (RCC1) repeat